MRALRIIGVAFLTSGIGCFIGFVAGDYLTQLYHVSNFEGGRGYAVVFLCAPLGIIAGFVTGLLAAIFNRRAGFVGFLRAQGVALGALLLLTALVCGISYLAVDKPPTIDGHNLTLDFELKIPATIPLPADLNVDSLHASLYAGGKENQYAGMDYPSVQRHDGYAWIAGTALLTSHNSERTLMASIGNTENGTQFIDLNLPSSPGKQNESLSEWVLATKRFDLTPVPAREQIAMRYRVREISEMDDR